jgi:GT2 family glycosyltransferase
MPTNSPSKPSPSALESALWSVVQARDSALIKTHETYQKQLRELESALEETKEFLSSVESDRDAAIAKINAQQARLDSNQIEYEAVWEKVHAARHKWADSENQLRLQRQKYRPERLLTDPFATYASYLDRILVPFYHERLAKYLVQLSMFGATVHVFECPEELSTSVHASIRFHSGSVWPYLSCLDSMFNERAYLQKFPDVAGCIDEGGFRSGWEHFMQFGRREHRFASPEFDAGLADYDAILLDESDLAKAGELLAGRSQPYHLIALTGVTDIGVWKSQNCAAIQLPCELVLLRRPPAIWLDVPRPTKRRRRFDDWPTRRACDLYPAKTPTGKPWPKISIVTVSYNQAPYLEETLKSVIDQCYPNLEYIVVDGGSSDGSVEIIKRYEKSLTWWVSEKDNGQSHALNKGFERATGRILTWLNSDDRLAPGSLFTIADQFERYSPDIVVGRCARVKDQDSVPHHLHQCSLPVGEISELSVAGLLDLENSWMAGKYFHQPEVFFSRDLFDRSGGHIREDLYFSMDYDLWVRMAKAGAKVLSIPEITTIFRLHAAQKTGGAELPFLPELRSVNSAHLAKIKQISTD